MLLSVRTKTPIHDTFAAFVTTEIIGQLKVISHRANSTGEFAARVVSAGSARIFLKDDIDWDGQGTRVFHMCCPDGQFHFLGAQYPGIVLEIGYSQYGKKT